MSEFVLRCGSCGAGMRVARANSGRVMRCPACLRRIDVPVDLAFDDADEGAARDRRRAWSLQVAVGLSAIPGCVPVLAGVWWIAAGSVQRARDEERAVDPMLLNARNASAVLTIAWLGVFALLVTVRLL
jgi:hypothetical protein